MTLDPRDMDGDGDTDLLFSDRKGPARGIGWLENPGDAHRPWQRHNIGPAGEAEVMFAEPADLDGDGHEDLVAPQQLRLDNVDGLEDVLAAVRPGTILACRRLDKSGKAWRTHAIQLPSIAGTAKAVAVGDIDLDGRPDLVFSCEQAMGSRHGVMWLSGSLPHRQWTPHEVSGPEGVKFDLVRLLDLDGDGDLDILTCEETENLGVIWYENPAR